MRYIFVKYTKVSANTLSSGEVLQYPKENGKSDLIDSINTEKSFYLGNYTLENTPMRITIPRVGIDLPVKMANVVNGEWELFSDSAAFGRGSSPLGVGGNTVIFAHARQGLFYPLKKCECRRSNLCI